MTGGAGAALRKSRIATGTKKKKEEEDRDPSPSPGVKPVSSTSSDEHEEEVGDEPWDEPPSSKASETTPPTTATTTTAETTNPFGDMMKSALNFDFLGGGGESDRLEDGDLPTLSLKKERVNGQYVSGERTTRPLSPPSRKGLDVADSASATSGTVNDNDPPMKRRSRGEQQPRSERRPPTPRTAKQAAAHRQFWSQLNAAPSPVNGESSLDQDHHSRGGIAEEQGPDDEMAARRKSRALELDDAPKQADETFEGEESYRGNVSKAHSYDDDQGNCFDYTLASIGGICGNHAPPSPIKGGESSDRPVNARQPRELNEEKADDAEELTAIEVEYVDPGPIPRDTSPTSPKRKKKKKESSAKSLKSKAAAPLAKSKTAPSNGKSGKGLPTAQASDGESVELRESEATAWSSSRKNAVLAAMARKAKEDFQKHEDEVSKQSNAAPTAPRKVQASDEQPDNSSDIYNNFSPSEKRKFLKLINLGLTPTESTSRVVEERKGKDSVKGQGGSSKKRFSFWKKSAKIDAARSPSSPRQAAAGDAPSVSSTAAVGEDADVSVAQDEGGSNAVASRGTVSAENQRDKTYARPVPPVMEEVAAIPDAASSGGIQDAQEIEDVVGTSSVTKPESSDSEEGAPEGAPEGSSSTSAAVVAVGATAGVVAGAGLLAAQQASDDALQETHGEESSDSSEDEEDSVRGSFPRSGVNYYDGVRRELPEEDVSDDDFGAELHSPSGKASKGSRLASLTQTPRSQGFSSLYESERSLSDSEGEVPSSGSKSIAKPLSPPGQQSKPSSKERSDPLSPGGSRRRYLGIPMLGSKGFTPLEEDEGVVERNVDEAKDAEAKGVQQAPRSGFDNQMSEPVVAAATVATTVTAVEAGPPENNEDVPLPSMDDPFHGLETDDVDGGNDPLDQTREAERATPEQPEGQQIPQMDTSLNSYLDSATMQTYATSQQDQHSVVAGSVVSARSTYTAGTGMTGHTQSSRKRRPGAAKERIAKAKQAVASSSTRKGWHESIRAAAATNNRVWDPQKGWIDYKDPATSGTLETSAEEPIKISLDGVSMRSPSAKESNESVQDHDQSKSSSVVVPLPPGLEKQEDDVVSTGRNEKNIPGQVDASGAPPLTPKSLSDSEHSHKTPVQASDKGESPRPRSVVSEDSSRSRGWVDSMREASAEVSKDGRRWDPEKGWVGLDKSVIESSPLTPRSASESKRDLDPASNDEPSSEQVAVDVNENEAPNASPDAVFAALTQAPTEENEKEAPSASPDAVFAALTQAPTEERLQDIREFVKAQTSSVVVRNEESAADSLVESPSKTKTSENRSEQSTGGADQSAVPGAGEKYVQLEDNGSVKSFRRDLRSKKQVPDREEHKLPFHPASLRKVSGTDPSRSFRSTYLYDDDKAPLLTEGSADTIEERAPEVKVVKERVGEDDFNLFTRDDGATLGTESESGSPSKRRGTGPVDVDEVDDLDSETESEDDEEEGHHWEPDSYMKGRVSPGMFVKPRSERSALNNSGFSHTVSPTKTPPKLQKSKRDTSPIRTGFAVVEDFSPREVVSPAVVSPSFIRPSPATSPGREEGGHAIEPTVSIGDESAGSSRVKLMAQEWELRAKHGTNIMHDQSADSFEYDERHVTALGDFGPSGHEQNDWTSSNEKQSDQSVSSRNQEWKSFLGKKVQAETSAAMTLQETKQRDVSKPGIPLAPSGPSRKALISERGVPVEHGDSSFSFTDGPSDPDGSPAMSASSAAARRRDRAAQQQSSSPGFSDVSPIPAADDEFDYDDNSRMEQVSDTGTAVEQSSFMKRLSACAAPLSRALNQNMSGDALPSAAHMEFMRTNPAGQASGVGSFVPAGLCGRPDVVPENEDSEENSSKRSMDEKPSSPSSPGREILKEVKERSSSRGRSRAYPDESNTRSVGNDMRSSSSVTSDDFGARTSYLEAIAMRTAVSSKKKKKSRKSQDKDKRSVVSDEASGSTLSHSERWQAFLERKASQTASSPGSRAQSSTDVSRAAERYASEKVEEMMQVMATRSNSTPKGWRRDEERTLDSSYGDSSTASPLSPYRLAADGDRPMSSKKSKRKSESAKAAEELAAARVEAMMAAMTSSNLDEGEI